MQYKLKLTALLKLLLLQMATAAAVGGQESKERKSQQPVPATGSKQQWQWVRKTRHKKKRDHSEWHCSQRALTDSLIFNSKTNFCQTINLIHKIVSTIEVITTLSGFPIPSLETSNWGNMSQPQSHREARHPFQNWHQCVVFAMFCKSLLSKLSQHISKILWKFLQSPLASWDKL